MNDVNLRIAQLSPAKRALLEQRLKQKAVNANGFSSIERRENPNSAPLSSAQTRMWLLDQLEPGNPAYNRPSNLKLTGRLNVVALETSLNEIVRRHEVLRTSFRAVDGQPVQANAPSLALKMPIVDLSCLSLEERKNEAQRLATKEAQRPFDLSRLPLVRATLLKLGEQEYILLLTMHHIIFDGWSMGVLLRELAKIYEAFSTGKPSPFPELPIQYADFAHWQQQRLQENLLESELDYWKEQLSGDLPVLDLPTDRPRAAVQTNRGARQEILLSQNLSQSLKDLSRTEGVTLFMTLLAAFQILLHRYTGQEDIIVGAPIAGRDRIEIENLIGVFINTLVLRTLLNGNLTFKELLSRVRKIVTGAIAHQEISLEKLAEELQPERYLSHTPLFQVLFQLRNVPQEAVEVPGLKFQEFQLDRGIAAFDLTLDIIQKPTGLFCVFEYNADLFDAGTVTRIAEHYHTLLEEVTANPQEQISELPLLSEAERHQLLMEWNDTTDEYPTDKYIHQLFEEQVEQTPNAVAVVFEDQQLTYRELNARANQLARYLKSLGVKPEVLVGICLERSVAMIVGLLGILKAGGVYVPFDPHYPEDRLSYMLEDSRVEALLTQRSLESSLPSYDCRVFCLDSEWHRIEQYGRDNLEVETNAENLAYVIYTSGSTGKPKGVMNTHRGIHNRLCWMQSKYQLNSSDRVVQKTPFSFDVSVWEFFWTLMTGATMVVAKPEGHKDSNYLVNLIAQQQITTIHFVPSMLQVFLQESDLERCSSLKRVFCSGEALPFELTKRFFDRLSCELHNLYGPTEAAIDVTFWQCQPEDDLQVVPIGRPIANTQTYILDKYLQPVPIGVLGELYLGGINLARGYFNRPELTAEKFIPNPINPKISPRLYKTGDLARYLPDGNIEFLGRIDNQVKIRGFRIELGEIESFLSTHNQIQQAVVIAREDVPGDKRLVAYLVTSSESLTSSQLRQFLKQKLPEYMVPSAFVLLENLPLTPNGKIDRRALPAPDISQLKSTKTFVEPGTLTEQQLAEIWREVLGIKIVGIQDNFFELGGHSLLATQALSRIRQNLKVELPLRSLFEASTIEELGSHIENILWTKTVLNSSNDEIDNYYEEGEL